MALTLLIALQACGQGGESRAGAVVTLTFALDSSATPPQAVVAARNLSRDELAVARSLVGDSAWSSVLRVSVAPDSSARPITPMNGRYTVTDGAIEFRPRFPLDAGRPYVAILNRRPLRSTVVDSLVMATFALPAGDRTPRTFVKAIYPDGDSVPENLLRLYVEFSAPMSRTGGLDFISLRDEQGREVKAAFLPLDADFWNADRTRYTAFLDPGRVKQGILPNEQMGRAIRAGRRYSIVVDSMWRDARGVPLTASFQHALAVTAADERAIDMKAWRIAAPAANGRGALTVSFPKALDRGLLARALGVESIDGSPIAGEVTIARGERTWQFMPQSAWAAGGYRLVVLSILEDPAGNRIDKPFEVDVFNRVDSLAPTDRRLLTFTIR